MDQQYTEWHLQHPSPQDTFQPVTKQSTFRECVGVIVLGAFLWLLWMWPVELIKRWWHTLEIMSHCECKYVIYTCDLEIWHLFLRLSPWSSHYILGASYKPLAIWIVLLMPDSYYTYMHSQTLLLALLNKKAFLSSKRLGSLSSNALLCIMVTVCVCCSYPGGCVKLSASSNHSFFFFQSALYPPRPLYFIPPSVKKKTLKAALHSF